MLLESCKLRDVDGHLQYYETEHLVNDSGVFFLSGRASNSNGILLSIALQHSLQYSIVISAHHHR
jgi:hypothetical protein